MSKIAIISQPDQGVLIDVGGCTTLSEATHHLTSTLQISSEFWKGLNVELNLGKLELGQDEVASIIAIAAEVGVRPSQVFAESETTRTALLARGVSLGVGAPMKMPAPAPAEQDNQAEESACAPEQSASADAEQEGGKQEAGSPEQPAATATEGGVTLVAPAQPAVLYLRQTLRSGQAVSHKGHLVIIGDVNPGAEVIAEGDITVFGALRGMAHAGTGGDVKAEIRALRLEPIQIRIAHAIARSPDRAGGARSTQRGPETARIVNGSVRIQANHPD